MGDGLVIERGRLLCYRLFDVGQEVRLETAERLVGDPEARRAQLAREGAADALVFAAPPLGVPLGKRKLDCGKLGHFDAELTARVYDYGAVSLLFEIELASGTSVAELIPIASALYESPDLDRAARTELDALLKKMAPAIEAHEVWKDEESYTVVYVERLSRPTTVAELRSSAELAKLIAGETSASALASPEQEDLLKNALSYFHDDLVIIGWNSAFVLEPSGSRDIPLILELANAQLLELRYYDDALDRELAKIYGRFEVAIPRFPVLLWNPYTKLARDVLKRLIGLTEFTERVENAVKIVGDFYLVRVYRTAINRFQVPSWQRSVDQKLSLVSNVYTLLKDDIGARRSLILEITIVALIVFEILMALK